MTVITPVFMVDEGRDGVSTRPAFFVASRGHHADVGGIAPGSMPPLSKTLEEVSQDVNWCENVSGKTGALLRVDENSRRLFFDCPSDCFLFSRL